MENLPQISLSQMCGLLSETAVLLISNGANSTRTKRNIDRIAKAYGFRIAPFFSHSAIVLSVEDTQSGKKRTIVKDIKHYHVNYSVVSEVSILTWHIHQEKPSLHDIEAKLHKISKIQPYSEPVKVAMIGLATAALAQIFDGKLTEFAIAFLAALVGYYGRKVLIKRNYNVYICWLVAAFLSASTVNLLRRMGVEHYQAALTACVLWLVPGVPLINGFLDILENSIVSGWAKVAMGFMMVFMIAVGFYLSLFIFGYGSTV